MKKIVLFLTFILFTVNFFYSNDDIFYAVEMNSFSNIKRILKTTNADVVNSENKTPLMIAAKKGYIKIAKYLIYELADIHATDEDGWSALDWAFYTQKLNMAKYLISKGCKVYAAPRYRKKSLIFSVITKDIFLLRYLFNQNADINTVDEEGITLIMHAIQSNNDKIITFLIENKATLYNKDIYDRDVFIIATKYGNLKFLKYLFEKRKKNYSLQKLLKISTEFKHLEITKYLINKFKKNKDDLLKFIFFKSAVYNNLETLIYCLKKGIHINLTDNDKKTALIHACENSNLKIVKYLVNNKADITLRDNSFLFGKTALDYARNTSLYNSEVLDFFKEKF